jgi:hypothetical protein
MIIDVPEKFRPHIKVDYPPGNDLIFEEWFYQNYKPEENTSDRFYVPIFWTSYHVNNGYGKDRRAIRDLQREVNTFNRGNQFFSIIQYDSGPLVSLPNNWKLYAMSGPRIDYPLPLICKPHQYEFSEPRDIFCNFIGRITHGYRKQLLYVLKGRPEYLVKTDVQPIADYCKILSKSTFTLCPRGFGQSSFRIAEALQRGSIPVYISDEFVIPHNHDFNDYGVLVHVNDISRVPEILSGISPEEIKRKQEAGVKIYNEKFSYSGCKKLILENL